MLFDPSFERWLEGHLSTLKPGRHSDVFSGRSQPEPDGHKNDLTRGSSASFSPLVPQGYRREEVVFQATCELQDRRQNQWENRRGFFLNNVDSAYPSQKVNAGVESMRELTNHPLITNSAIMNNTMTQRTPIYKASKTSISNVGKTAVRGKRKSDPYQLVFDDDDSDSATEVQDYTLSARERVEQILRETELTDSEGLNAISPDSGIPEPDFTFNAFDLEEDDIFDIPEATTKGRHVQDEFIGDKSGWSKPWESARHHSIPVDRPFSQQDGNVGVATSNTRRSSHVCRPDLETNLATGDTEYTPETSFVEFSSRQAPEPYEDGNQLQHTRKGKRNDQHPLIAVRFQKCDLRNVEDESFIDDDPSDVISSHLGDGFHGATEQSQGKGNLQQTRLSDNAAKFSLESDIVDRNASKGGSLLPLDTGDLNRNDREADITLDNDFGLRHDVTMHDCDTSPIIRQTELSVAWQRKRRRLLIAIGVVGTSFALGAFGAIVYLVIRMLSS